MELSDLGLDRYMYKGSPGETTESSSSMSENNDNTPTSSPAINGGTNPEGNVNAANVLTGTVITACLVQTSGKFGRVELNSFVTNPGLLTASQKQTDSLVAYKNNVPVLVINEDGLFATQITVDSIEIASADIDTAIITSAQIFDLDVTNITDKFNYVGDVMPQVFGGSAYDTGTERYLPSGWSVTQNGTGDYTITHNLNNANYAVTVTAILTFQPCSISVYDIFSNSFSILFADAALSPMDSAFMFTLVNYLP